MKSSDLKYLIILLVIALIGACKSKEKEIVRPEKAQFLSDASGILYYFHEEGDGDLKPVNMQVVKVILEWGLRDSLIVTKKMTNGPVEFQIRDVPAKGNIFDGLRMMDIGDSATFIINADKYFSPNPVPQFITPGSDLYFDIRLLEIKSEQEYNAEMRDRLNKMREDEQIYLKEYLDENDINAEPLASGLYYMPVEKGSGPKVETGKMLILDYEYFLIDGTKLYSTWDAKKPLEFRFGSKFDTPGMNEALSMMRVGDRTKLIVPSNIGYGEQGRAQFIPPYSTLVYEVEVLDVISEEDYKKKTQHQEKIRQKQIEVQKELEAKRSQEPGIIQKYIQDNQITVEPNDLGMYYIEEHEGEGDFPQPGDKVKIHYANYTLDGELLQSTHVANHPFEFTLGRSEVILGWEQAIRLMKEGGKARILLPSRLAYGERGAGKPIPPFTPLIYDIELLEVQKRTAGKTSGK